MGSPGDLLWGRRCEVSVTFLLDKKIWIGIWDYEMYVFMEDWDWMVYGDW
jgi:hypothetical protein